LVIGHWSFVIWFSLIGLLGACSEVRKEPALTLPAGPSLVWPDPPERPRIQFLKTVASPNDLAIRPSFWERLGEILAGKAEAWMIRPTGIAVRGEILYVADPGAQAIWILDGAAGRFKAIRSASGQRLVSPVAVTVGGAGKIYVADSYLGKVLIFDPDGNLTGSVGSASFQRPAGVAFDEVLDRLYVADSAAHRIWILSGQGKMQGSIGGHGSQEGEFNYPTHVALDRNGTLYVTDSLGFRIQMFSRTGRIVGSFGHHGDATGDFAAPKGVGVDSEGHVYVVDALFDAVQIFDRAGHLLLGFGQRGLAPGQFWLPSGLFIDEKDRIYVADSYNQRVQVFQYIAGGGNG
jgi:DNA-binding beta-propeller fold protein YncE